MTEQQSLSLSSSLSFSFSPRNLSKAVTWQTTWSRKTYQKHLGKSKRKNSSKSKRKSRDQRCRTRTSLATSRRQVQGSRSKTKKGQTRRRSSSKLSRNQFLFHAHTDFGLRDSNSKATQTESPTKTGNLADGGLPEVWWFPKPARTKRYGRGG